VAVDGDTLRAVVRNLSPGELQMRGGPYAPEGANIAIGTVDGYQPARTALEFALHSAGEAVEVTVTLATLHFAERGTVQVTAQAIIRQA
jgi:hypothetical protein